jgi:hypothetical protein
MTSSLPHTNNSSNRLNELFDRVVNHIQRMNGNQLTEQEAIEAARNWLGFCSKLEEIEKTLNNSRLELDCGEG